MKTRGHISCYAILNIFNPHCLDIRTKYCVKFNSSVTSRIYYRSGYCASKHVYVVDNRLQSVSESVDLGFRPSHALTRSLRQSPEPGSTVDLTLGWKPEDRAQLAAFCGHSAVLRVLVDSFDRFTETDESNNVASVNVNMINCPGRYYSGNGRFVFVNIGRS